MKNGIFTGKIGSRRLSGAVTRRDVVIFFLYLGLNLQMSLAAPKYLMVTVHFLQAFVTSTSIIFMVKVTWAISLWL